MGLVLHVFWHFLLSSVFLVAGIASIIVYSLNATTICGIQGFPPLAHWVLGTGIGYTIIGVMYMITAITILLHALYKKFIPFLNMYAWQGFANVCALFSVPWTCVGINSCFCQGLDCATLNTPIWVTSLVIILFFTAFVPFAITFHCAEHLKVMRELKEKDSSHPTLH